MGRKNTNGYIQPIKSDGTLATFAPGADTTLTGRGVYTLAANTTYYFPYGGQDAPRVSVELEWDANIVITSANIEDTNVSEKEASNYSQGTAWVPETPATGYVAAKNASSNTNSTIATNGSAAGAAIWNVADIGSERGRLAVVVGATPGEVRCSTWGKE